MQGRKAHGACPATGGEALASSEAMFVIGSRQSSPWARCFSTFSKSLFLAPAAIIYLIRPNVSSGHQDNIRMTEIGFSYLIWGRRRREAGSGPFGIPIDRFCHKSSCQQVVAEGLIIPDCTIPYRRPKDNRRYFAPGGTLFVRHTLSRLPGHLLDMDHMPGYQLGWRT
jgi:hypothetical protein